MAHNDNKYTVHQRLADLTSRVAELEAENKRLRVHLVGELKTAVNDAKNAFHDGRDGAPGRDGESIVGPKGDKGERGDITIVGDVELQAAVTKLRAEKARAQAAFLVALDENSQRPHSGLKKVLAATLEGLKREAGL